MNFKIKNILLAVASATILSSVMTTEAKALGWAVSDYELLAYLGGTTNGGSGVVELLTSLNSSIIQNNSIIRNQGQNDQALSNASAQVDRMNAIRSKHIPSINGCADATRASSGGRSSSGTVSSGYNNLQKTSEMILDKTPRAEKFQETLSDQKNIGLCTKEDVEVLKTYGCSAIGDYSNNQGNASSIIYPPLTDKQIANGTIPMGGLTAEQQKIRNQNISLVVGVDTLSPLYSSNQMSTEEGAAYEYKRQQSNLRKTLALGILMKDASIENGEKTDRNGNKISNNSFVGKFDWNDQSENGPSKTWDNVFGKENIVFPKVPSEWDLLNYQVYSRYASTTDGALQIMLPSMSADDILKEITKMNAISLRLQLLMADNQRDTNKLLSSILATLIEKNDSETQERLKSDINIVPIGTK